MQITRVELKNIKNHAEAAYDFSPGVVAICGPNGAGKTSILEAIAWALFDHLDYKREDFVKRGAKRGQVAVSFISAKDERAYDVHRDTAGGYYVYDPDTKTRLVEQKGQVVKWLREHIGVDETTDLSVLFKTTIGVPQGTFTYDFTLPPARRKEVFDQILKVEEYRKAADSLRDTLKHLDTRLTETERTLAALEGELKAYDETKEQFDALAAQLTQLERDAAQAQTARDRATEAVTNFDELKQQLETLRATAENLSIKLKLRQQSLATAREALAQAQQAAQIVKDSLSGYEGYQAATTRLTELEQQRIARDAWRAELQQVERELIELQSQAARHREQRAEIEAAQNDLAQLADALAEQTKLESELAALREARGERQSLERQRVALDHDLAQMRDRYAKLAREIEKADELKAEAERAAALESERQQLDATIQQHELALKHAATQQNFLQQTRQTHARLQQELAQRQAELTRLDDLQSQAAQLVEFETAQQRDTERLAHLRAELARDEEMIQSLATGGICPLLTEKCLNLKEGESLETRFRSGLVARRAEIKTLQAALKSLTTPLAQARSAQAEAAQLPRVREDIARLEKELVAQAAQLAQRESEQTQPDAAQLKQLKAQRTTLDEQLRSARDAERRFHQAAGMRDELEELKAQGLTKRTASVSLNERLAQLGDTATQFATTEATLQALNDPRSRAAALQRAIKNETTLRKAIKQNETRTATAAEQQQTLQATGETFAALDAQLGEANAARALHERAYHAYLSNRKTAETVAAHEQEVASISAEIATTESALTETQTSLQALAARYDEAAHARSLAELEQARARVTQLATQLEHLRAQHTQLQTRLAQFDEARAQRAAQLAEKDRFNRLRETADFVRDILQKAAPFITESYLFSISIEANQLYRELSGRHDVTLKWEKDYEITLEEEGRERPFANLSGGEQMAAALAIRLALLKELSEINLAFFDEPTTNMDEERRRNLAQQIGRIKDFQQLFVISHDDTFEGHTDQVILLGERVARDASM